MFFCFTCHPLLETLSATMIQKSLFFFFRFEHLTSKILSFDFYPRLFTVSVSFGFHCPPLLAFQTDRLRTSEGWI